MATKKALIAETAQKYLEKADWEGAIREMEKLFAIIEDPLIRVRIGDVSRKLNREAAAIQEYVRAADLFATKGFVAKALAQYKLALRLDSSNEEAWSKMERLHSSWIVTKLQQRAVGNRIPRPFVAVVSHYSIENNPGNRAV